LQLDSLLGEVSIITESSGWGPTGVLRLAPMRKSIPMAYDLLVKTDW